ncbi:SAM-dependent methyltransferase [Nocardia rhamnosiphila]|uniref:SAM-dependent methyltransferase n=1 Tax=Nocardia rhamnosiphila TaxID=426716 RepID=UPI003403AFA3
MSHIHHTAPAQTYPARLYNYFLGGTGYDEVDRVAAAEVEKVTPSVRTMARVNREFMYRTIAYLAERGIRQFLDIGSGIPAEPNLHQIAQAVIPEAKIVYVDNDPGVLARASGLLTTTSQGSTVVMEADVTQPATILRAPVLHEILDFDEPVALSLISVMHFISDRHHPYAAVATLLDALAPGSYLVLSHSTADFAPRMTRAAVEVYRASGMDPQPRTRAETLRFFDGLDLVAPGVVPPHRWRHPGSQPPAVMDAEVGFYGGVGCKP